MLQDLQAHLDHLSTPLHTHIIVLSLALVVMPRVQDYCFLFRTSSGQTMSQGLLPLDTASIFMSDRILVIS